MDQTVDRCPIVSVGGNAAINNYPSVTMYFVPWPAYLPTYVVPSTT